MLRTLAKVASNRKILHIHGPDTVSFLNGLVSIKMLPSTGKKNQHTITSLDEITQLNESLVSVDPSGSAGLLHCDEWIQWGDPDQNAKLGLRRDGRYGTMMKSNGRVFSDFFMYPSPLVPQGARGFLIEFLDPQLLNPIKMMLKIHKLNAKVEFDVVNCDVWHFNDHGELLDQIIGTYFNNAISKSPEQASQLAEKFANEGQLIQKSFGDDKLLGFAIDERNNFLGYRMLTPVDSVNAAEDLIAVPDTAIVSREDYELNRLSLGVVEAGDLPKSRKGSTLPFEMNVDWYGGINTDKGCYVGQELTLRSWTSNAIPKRILPITLDEPLPNDDIEGWLVKSGSAEDPSASLPSPATNASPFGSTATVKPRRDRSVVGELICAKGQISLCSIRKDYFDYDYAMSGEEIDTSTLNKRVKLCKDDKIIQATIQGQVWV